MLMLPQITGKWRYLLTGLPLAVLLGLIVHAVGQLAVPFGMWRRFRGTCNENTPEEGAHLLSVTFHDGRHLTHTAVFRTDAPEAASLHAGDDVDFAIRSEIFVAGSYENAPDRSGDIVLRTTHRRWLLRSVLLTLLREAVKCCIAFAVFLLAMRVCFP